MIELTLEDFMVWALGIAILLIGFLRLLSRYRRNANRERHRKGIYYCNVCVKYISRSENKKEISCPGCERTLRRGRNRNLG